MKNQSRFDGLTPTDYDRWVAVDPDYNELQKWVARLVLDRLPFRKFSGSIGGRVLDLGCGTGVTSGRILQGMDETGRVAGVDINRDFLNEAERSLGPRFCGVCQDILGALSAYESDRPDVVVSVLTVHNLPLKYRMELFPAIYRILRPGGCLVLGDKIAFDDDTVHNRHFAKWISLLDSLRDNPDLYSYAVRHECEDYTNRMTERELTCMLNCAGFIGPEVLSRLRLYAMHVVAVVYKPTSRRT